MGVVTLALIRPLLICLLALVMSLLAVLVSFVGFDFWGGCDPKHGRFPFIVATYAFWRSAYISNLFSSRNRTLVITDWLKKTILGRDISRE